MALFLPQYHPPDFSAARFVQAPAAFFERVEKPGVAPDNYHATSIYPEYFQLRNGKWHLLKESRMDCVVVEDRKGTGFWKSCSFVTLPYTCFTMWLTAV